MTETLELSLRGLPEWLIREYFLEMGASPADDPDAPAMVADGWAVSWTHQRMQVPGSSLRLTQFDLVFTGGDLPRVHDDFMKKAQRGGG